MVKTRADGTVSPFLIAGIASLVIVIGTVLALYKHQTVSVHEANLKEYEALHAKGWEIAEDIRLAKARKTQRRLPIVLYHYVEYVRDVHDTIRKSLAVTPDVFEHQIVSLKNGGYAFYFMKDVPRILEGRLQYREKSVVLTFDDGYEDFYTVAYPILRKHAVPSTVYVVNNFIGRYNYMSEGQIRELLSGGLVEIGSHTLDHLMLKGLDDDTARKQIRDSKHGLEERFGIKVETFAYPYGSFSSRSAELVREASFTAAVSVITGMQESMDDIYILPRIRPGILGTGDVVKTLEAYQK